MPNRFSCQCNELHSQVWYAIIWRNILVSVVNFWWQKRTKLRVSEGEWGWGWVSMWSKIFTNTCKYPIFNSVSALSPGAGLARTNRERGASWEGCKTCYILPTTPRPTAGFSAPIPQRHAHHHIIRRGRLGTRQTVLFWFYNQHFADGFCEYFT